MERSDKDEDMRASVMRQLDHEWSVAIEVGRESFHVFSRLIESQQDCERRGLYTTITFDDEYTQTCWVIFQEMLGRMVPRPLEDMLPLMDHEDTLVQKMT